MTIEGHRNSMDRLSKFELRLKRVERVLGLEDRHHSRERSSTPERRRKRSRSPTSRAPFDSSDSIHVRDANGSGFDRDHKESLRDIFSAYGEIYHLKLSQDCKSCNIRYADQAMRDKALRDADYLKNEKKLTVDMFKTSSKR